MSPAELVSLSGALLLAADVLPPLWLRNPALEVGSSRRRLREGWDVVRCSGREQSFGSVVALGMSLASPGTWKMITFYFLTFARKY